MKCSQIIKEFLLIIFISTLFFILQWVVKPMNDTWTPNKYSFIVSMLNLVFWFIYGIHKYECSKKIVVYAMLWSVPLIIEFSYMCFTANGAKSPWVLNVIFFILSIQYFPLIGLEYLINNSPNIINYSMIILYLFLPFLASMLGLMVKIIWRKIRIHKLGS